MYQADDFNDITSEIYVLHKLHTKLRSALHR